MKLEFVIANAKKKSKDHKQSKPVKSHNNFNYDSIINSLLREAGLVVKPMTERERNKLFWYDRQCKSFDVDGMELLKFSFSYWSDIVMCLILLFNKSDFRYVTNWRKAHFDFTFYFKNLYHIIPMYKTKCFLPLEIFEQYEKPVTAFNFFSQVLRKISAGQAANFYKLIPESKYASYCGLVKSVNVWRSLSMDDQPCKRLWYEPKEFKLKGHELKFPWSMPDYFFKIMTKDFLLRQQRKLGFDPKEFETAPEKQDIIPTLITLEHLAKKPIILVVSDDLNVLNSIESLIGTVYTLTTSKLSALITGRNLMKWRKEIPSDKDYLFDDTQSTLEMAFKVELGVVARLNAEYEFDSSLMWLSSYFTNRFRFKLPLVCTYLKKNIKHLSNGVLFKEIATLYPDNIASVLCDHSQVLLIKDFT